MAGVQELFFEIYVVILCLNAGLLIVDALQDTPLRTPFDVTLNVTGVTPPSIYNFTLANGTLVQNVTTNVLNDTDNDILNPLQDFFFFPLQILWTLIQFITGAFVFQVLLIFGFPDIVIFVLQGVLGILLVRNIIYLFTGR